MTTQKKSSGFGGGLWIILVLIFGGAIFFGVKTIMSLNSGGTRQLPDGSWVDAHLQITDIGYFWFSAGLFVVGIIVVFLMRSDR